MDANARVGLIGDPVEHSLSPAFQQPAFDALGLAIRYELWHTPAARLQERLQALRDGVALGANVTVPHKEACRAAMDELSDVARRAGAVNTIVSRDGRLFGDNTDVHGFLASLRARDFDVAACNALVLGAGGAARGVIVALLDAGARTVTVANRTPARAARLAAALDDARVRPIVLDAAVDAARGVRLLVNATALGWGDGALPCDVRVFARLASDALAYDLTYRVTPFLQAAEVAGVEPLDGLAMLVQQGARSFELWTGRAAPIDLMWHAAVRARDTRRANP